ncbi:phage tail tape measure protein [Pseudomonas helleri]|uniref:phage tail tape measure protein n=1 Tax=Pseudomonas helleri TaxID=1608996 RepID=UPI0024327DD8|nr:phage tail tape measure protein [Pseudomonas helleri]
MANDLRIQVLLNAIDKVTGPLRRITGGSTNTAKALKAARDQLKALKDQQSNIASFKKQQGAIAATSDKLNTAQEKLRQLKTAMNNSGNAASGKFKNDMRKAHEAVRDLTTKLQEQRKGLTPHMTKLREAGIATGKLGEHEARLKTEVDAANRSLNTQKDRLNAIGKRQNALATARANYDRQRQTAQSMAGTGAMAAASGGAALYAGARLIKPGVEFDASMSRVQAISRLDKNDPELKAMRDQSRHLGGSTQFTGGQVADGQGFLGMAGFNPKAIRAAMPGMLDLAAAGGTDLAQTADISSNILSGLGLQADKMGKLSDVLVGTFTRSNTNLQMLGDGMKYAAPMAKTYGVEMEVAAGMLGKLGDAGLQGSMGGTALSSIMNRLAAPPKAARKALDELNIQTADVNGNLREIPDILKEIYDKTQDMGTAKKGGLFKAIAGEEAVKGMAHLVDQAGIGELQTFIAILRNTQGEAAKTARVMADNLKGDVITLSSAWQDLGIEIEEQQDGTLRGLVQSITEIIRSVKNWARENPELSAGLIKTAAIIAGLAITVGGLMITLAGALLPFIALRFMLAQLGIRLPGLIGLVKGFGTVIRALSRFMIGPLITALRIVGIMLWGLAANPVFLTIAAVLAVLALAAYLIWSNWETLGPKFAALWEWIKGIFVNGTTQIVNFVSVGFNQIIGFFKLLWGEIKLVCSALFSELRTVWKSGLAGIGALILNWSPMGLFYNVFAGVMNYFGVELPGKFTEFGSMILDGLVNGLTSGLAKVKETITGIGDSTIGWFKEKLDINSPSRVFAELGGFTMAGLTQGLEGGQKGPLNALTSLTKQLTAVSALALSATTLPALAVDDRPPISSSPAATVYDSHDTYQLTFTAAPGMELQSLEKSLRAMLFRIENEKKARQRSKLSDLE